MIPGNGGSAYRGNARVQGERQTSREDADLVARLRAGDAEAFAELYRMHAGAVAAAVSDRIRDPNVRADAVQEAFARAFERLDTLRDPAAFRPWLLAIARRTAVDHVRASARDAELDDGAAGALPDHEPGPQQWAELEELASLVRGSFARLSQRDATALTLATRFGLSIADLAGALGISPGAAKVALHRARQRLRQGLRLQLVLQRRAGACSELRRLHEAGRLHEAARHLDRCETCGRAAEEVAAEVGGFDAGAAALSPQAALSR